MSYNAHAALKRAIPIIFFSQHLRECSHWPQSRTEKITSSAERHLTLLFNGSARFELQPLPTKECGEKAQCFICGYWIPARTWIMVSLSTSQLPTEFCYHAYADCLVYNKEADLFYELQIPSTGSTIGHPCTTKRAYPMPKVPDNYFS